MKAIGICFLQMLRQMKHDVMLLVIAFVPFFAGSFFRFVVPVAENLLTGYFSVDAILRPYYELIDLFLILLTPSMLNYVVAMVMLEEIDDHMTAYLAVTPLGKTGYLVSRLGITGFIAFPVSIFVARLFYLSPISIFMLAGIALAGTAQGVVAALLIVSLSKNKVEGMAVGKLATLFNLGMLAPYFISGNAQYFLSVFPSFWIAKAAQTANYVALSISLLMALLWITMLSERFMKKIT